MEVWTFINKKNKEIIRYSLRAGDECFGPIFYFDDDEEMKDYYSPWFVYTKEEAEIAFIKDVHPQFSINYKRPSTDQINLTDYEIKQFKMNG